MPEGISKNNMRLFGMPYQFTEAVDPRIDGVSKTIGSNFMKNVVLDAPIVTIIPGKPKYLPGTSDKHLMSHNIIGAMLSNNDEGLNAYIKNNDDKNFRYYDFQSSYIEYMKYVNILCRTTADFLGLDSSNFNIDGTPLKSYDWKNYRINRTGNDAYKSIVGNISSNIWSSISGSVKGILGFDEDSHEIDEYDYQSNSDYQHNNFVQFFVDPNVSCSDSISNETSESKIKGLVSGASDMMKELSFVMNSMGAGSEMDALSNFASNSMDQLGGYIGKIGTDGQVVGNLANALGNFLSLSSNVVKGENIIIPDIYQNSSYSKSYDLTVHLRTPYKNRYGYYLDVVAPLMHLLALALPRQATANSYVSPFLVKVYVPGLFNCNLGMVKSISVSKNNDSFSVDGYPCDIDVVLDIVDLYSDLSMTPASSPFLFVNNTSLIEYLANICGLSLIAPNIKQKLSIIGGSLMNSVKDIPSTVIGTVTERIDSIYASFLSLT